MSPSANAAKSYFCRTYARWQNLSTWHTWVLVCAAVAGATFCFNLVLIIWPSASGSKNGVAIITEGNCQDIKKSELWLHLGINVHSTLLLGGSNYTMQCLSALTREEIDKGQHSRVTLDIGIPSLKNLTRATRKNVLLWGFLAVSSVPLHLVYNSALFSTLVTYSYNILVVTPEFLSRADLGLQAYGDGNITAIQKSVIISIQGPSETKWQNMTIEECKKAYRTKFLARRLHLLAVNSKATPGSSPLLTIARIEALGLQSQQEDSYRSLLCDTSPEKPFCLEDGHYRFMVMISIIVLASWKTGHVNCC